MQCYSSYGKEGLVTPYFSLFMWLSFKWTEILVIVPAKLCLDPIILNFNSTGFLLFISI